MHRRADDPHIMEQAAPDVVLIERFVAEPEALFLELSSTTPWDERMRARKTASFGIPYNYSGMTYPDAPMPKRVGDLGEAMRERLGFSPNNCLANYYPDGGATMGFHSDSITELAPGTGVAIVSLGSARILRFRFLEDRSVGHDYELTPGSLLYMPAEVQRRWQHGVPKQEGAGPRISLTFRCLVTHGASRSSAAVG